MKEKKDNKVRKSGPEVLSSFTELHFKRRVKEAFSSGNGPDITKAINILLMYRMRRKVWYLNNKRAQPDIVTTAKKLFTDSGT